VGMGIRWLQVYSTSLIRLRRRRLDCGYSAEGCSGIALAKVDLMVHKPFA
jgi:hypothetical protein